MKDNKGRILANKMYVNGCVTVMTAFFIGGIVTITTPEWGFDWALGLMAGVAAGHGDFLNVFRRP